MAGTNSAAPAKSGGSVPAQSSAKSSVTIGHVAPLSGPVGPITAQFLKGVQLWMAQANEAAGVNGHRVRLVFADDQFDPARHKAEVQRIVETERAIAFVNNSTLIGRSEVDYIQSKRIPVVGSDGGADWVYDHSMYFLDSPAGDAGAFSTLNAFADVALPQGLTKFATITCTESQDTCGTYEKVWNARASEVGFQPVYRANATITQPDYTAECLAAMNAGAQVIALAFDTNSDRRVASSCRRQGYKGIFALVGTALEPSVASAPGLGGSVAGTVMAPWPATTPGMAELRSAAARFSSGTDMSGALVKGWLAAKLFEAATRNLPEPGTAADVLEGLWALRGDNLGGLTYSLSYTRDQPSPRRVCWGVVTIADGRWVAGNGAEVRCR